MRRLAWMVAVVLAAGTAAAADQGQGREGRRLPRVAPGRPPDRRRPEGRPRRRAPSSRARTTPRASPRSRSATRSRPRASASGRRLAARARARGQAQRLGDVRGRRQVHDRPGRVRGAPAGPLLRPLKAATDRSADSRAGPRSSACAASWTTCCRPTSPPEQVRVYVIENKEWNAFAMGNYSIYVFSGMHGRPGRRRAGHRAGARDRARHPRAHAPAVQEGDVDPARGASARVGGRRDRSTTTRAAVAQLAGDVARRSRLRRTATAATWRTRPTAWACATRTRPATTSPRARACGSASPRSTARRARWRTSSSATTRSSSARAANLEKQIALQLPRRAEAGRRPARSRPAPRRVRPARGRAPLPPRLLRPGHGLTASSSVTGRHAAGRSSTKKEIRPGMSATEVRGPPGQAEGGGRRFGAKSIWTYPASRSCSRAARSSR